MSSRTKSQNAALLRALHHGPVTALDALDRLGIARAAARVYDLRKDGYTINSTFVEVRNRHGETCRVAQYGLVPVPRQLLPVSHTGRGRVSAC